MPRGKSKKDNPELYQGSPGPSEPIMARQVAAHRRGGTHKVRDEHMTGSIYDTYNYKELLDTSKEHGIYRKDMKKVEMAWALKDNDEERKRVERDALLAFQRKQQEAKEKEKREAAEKQAQINAKHKRRVERERKRERDESCSENTLSDADIEAEEHARDEYKCENFGQALSDESWDSTSTESSARSVNEAIKPDCKLRLFEWPYKKMPPLKSTWAATFPMLPEPLPRHAPYAPMKVTTTCSRQKLVLPGLKYPPDVNPDFVPILNALTRAAARNGNLLGPLRKAIIESGVDWAQRTFVQGWNAHMYFHLGSRNETKALADTYAKWYLENRKLLRVQGKGVVDPTGRAARHAQRQRNKAKKTAEVYEVSQWRPLAMCYVPAYLDYGHERGAGNTDKKDMGLENLFFIRFPGCDVPHYYFWTREGEWGNPTFSNPAGVPGQLEKDSSIMAKEDEDDDRKERRRLASKHLRKSWEPIKTNWTRIRKPSITLHSTPPPSSSTNLLDTINLIEHHLYVHGLFSTLSTYRKKWLSNGKQSAWKTFVAALPTLWPSGKMPNAPPVEGRPGAKVAVKMAMIDCLKGGGETMFSPLHGGEAWTRDDDRVWGVVEVEDWGVSPAHSSVQSPEGGEDDEGDKDEPQEVIEDIGYETEDEALYRRCSVAFGQDKTIADPIVAWVEQVSPEFGSPPMPMFALEEELDLQEREDRYLQGCGNEKNDACPFCRMEWNVLTAKKQAAHMLSHSSMRTSRRQRISISHHAFGSRSSSARKPNFDRNPEVTLRPECQHASIYRGPSAQKLSPVDDGEAPYKLSPCVRTTRRCSTCNPETTHTPRKRSIGNEDSLKFLDMYSTKPAKRRKLATPYTRVVCPTTPR